MFGVDPLVIFAWIGVSISFFVGGGMLVAGVYIFFDESDWVGVSAASLVLAFVSGTAYACLLWVEYPSLAEWVWRVTAVLGVLLSVMAVVSAIQSRRSLSSVGRTGAPRAFAIGIFILNCVYGVLVWQVDTPDPSAVRTSALPVEVGSDDLSLISSVWIPLLVVSVTVVLVNALVRTGSDAKDDPVSGGALRSTLQSLSERIAQLARLEDRLESFGPRTLAYQTEEMGERITRVMRNELRSNIREWTSHTESLLLRFHTDLSYDIKAVLMSSQFPTSVTTSIDTSPPEHDLRRSIAETVREEIDRISLLISSTSGRNSEHQDASSVSAQPVGLVPIRELYHYLFTPLSQIEVATQLAVAKLEKSPSLALIENSLETVRAGVDVCKAVLAAYRELSVVSPGDDWQPRSVAEGLNSAATVYSARTEKQVDVEILLTDEPPEYSTNFIIAIVLPLLENAIAAAESASVVYVRGSAADKQYTIEVVNTVAQRPPTDRFFEPGYSTKQDHEGTGLSTVKRLVETQGDASVEVFVDEEREGSTSILVRFQINLPIGARE